MSSARASFEAFLRERETASNDYINGRAQPLLALSATSDPATFFPPNGKAVTGHEAVKAANQKGAQSFAEGSSGRFEILQSAAGDTLAFWTGIQHADAVLAGKDQPVPMKLRVTEVFRFDGAAWKLIHRHADEYSPD